MTIYVFDTDHLSLYGRNHPKIIENILAAKVQFLVQYGSVNVKTLWQSQIFNEQHQTQRTQKEKMLN